MKKIIVLVMVLFISTGLAAQKKVLLEDQDEIVAAAKAELDSAMMSPEGYFYLAGQKYEIRGAYTFDITVFDKGKVVSVFAVENNEGTVDGQNTLKDIILTYVFSFQMPKGKRYKFQYTFNYQ
jgi:hypothetical protein